MSHGMNFGFLCPGSPSPNGRKTAIIGAGPSGLAATGFLACLGYEVDVYDKLPKAGGLMVFGIPGERIPAERIEAGVESLKEKYGVKFHLRTKICGNEALNQETGDRFSSNLVSLGELAQDHDAVMICTGTWKSRKMNIRGEDLPGVYSGLEFLFPIRAVKYDAQKMKGPDVRGKVVAVVGAGYSAVDVAYSALAHGAAKVYMLYRRTKNEAPCGSYEVERLMDMGVKWWELVTPVRIVGEDKVEAIDLLKCTLGEPDETGRRCPMRESGEGVTLEADIVVTAIGEIATPPFAEELGLGTVHKNEVHWLQMTNIPGVFVAGDALTGPSKIGKAVYSGLRAARSLANWLDLKHLNRLEEYSDDIFITREDMK